MRYFLSIALLSFLTIEVAWSDPMVVIGNSDVPVQTIDQNNAKQIFLKQIKTWPNGQHIHPIDIKKGPLRDEFYRKVVGRTPGQLRAYWARQQFTGMGFPPKQVDSAEAAHRVVKETAGAVGYVGPDQVSDSVKIMLQPPQ